LSLEHAILGFLGARPRSGYDLKTRCFDLEAKAFWSADQAQIYRTLDRLDIMGLVKATRRRQTGKPDRKVFDLTAAGRDALAAWIASASPLTPPRDAFLMQIYFAAGASDDTIVALLGERRSLHQARLESLRAQAVELAVDTSPPSRSAALRGAAFDGAMATERATIDWLDDTIDAIREGHLPAREHTDTDSAEGLIGQAPA
jgi:DNA-binding PadR family transcriptional regulator